jgi:hypothetical protein
MERDDFPEIVQKSLIQAALHDSMIREALI